MHRVFCAIILTGFLSFSLTTFSFAQEGGAVADSSSPSIEPNWKPEISVRATMTFAPPLVSNLHANEPEFTRQLLLRDRIRSQEWEANSYTIQDNPLWHAAAAVDVDALFHPWPGLSLMVGVTGENRGISYGVSSTQNSILLPRYQFRIDTTLKLFGEEFGVTATAGDFREKRFGEGLFFNKRDVEGGEITLRYENFLFTIEKVGDAFAGVGLNLDDVDFYSVEYRDIPLPANITAGVGLNGQWFVQKNDFGYLDQSPRQLLLDSVKLLDRGFGFTGYVAFPDSTVRFYTQGSLRASEGGGSVMSRTAFLAGTSFNFATSALQLEGFAEYKFYGGLFNHGYRNTDVYYRDPEQSAEFANTIGPHLYQLRWFDLPFAQWPLFAEYQNLKDVTGWTLNVHAKWFLYERFALRGMLDMTYIVPEKEESFLYPFYDVGIAWEPYDNFSLILSGTNKGMNLDKHYPTFYLYSKPIGSLAFRWGIE
ncbi:MAG: hypothetical protein AB7H80_17405 [Candidatus Kapaibacterium sp.]